MRKAILSLTAVWFFSTLLWKGAGGEAKAQGKTFFDAQEYFEEECEEKEIDDDGEWNQYKRWESFWELRTFPNGEFPEADVLFNEYQKLKTENAQKGFKTNASNWTFIGPGVVPTNGGGAGRLNCMAFDPSNSNIIWVGAACGGLWKSADGGQTWNVSGTDLLPSLSISDIAIDPVNSQNMYIVTGDKYGIYPMLFTKGHYSAGVLKSTDGGLTWNSTGLSYLLSNNVIIQRLVISHADPQKLYVASANGLYASADGGATWNLMKAGKFYDFEMNPGNASILYTADSLKVYRSADGGANWSIVANAQGRTSIAVSKNFPNTVYVWAATGLYYSSDAGGSFNFRADPSGPTNPLGYYDMVLEVSPADENVLIAGGVDLAVTTDGGLNWTKLTTPAALHADQKACMFLPGSSTTAFVCNDGGLFKTTNQATSFTDMSNGLDIKQYYRMSSSFQNPAVVVAGAQDNGTDKLNGAGSANMIVWFDGEDCLVDYTNDQVIFASTQGGQFKRSTNGGAGFTNIPASGCYWTSPIVMDPSNHNVVYIGGAYIHKSSNNGATWPTTFVDPAFDGTCVYAIEIAKSNSNYIYASTFKHIARTMDGGTTWADITTGLPTASAAISAITISDTDPDKAWVSFSGFSAGNKIFQTNDGGATWINVSAGIPNVPVNCLEYQYGSNNFVYAGTDLGVFFKDTATAWVSYNNGMPNTIVNDLEMYYPTKKIRAATYGRGIWESDFQDSTSNPTGINEVSELSFQVYPNPSNGQFKIQGLKFKVEAAELTDVTGRSIQKLDLGQGSFDLNLDRGIYFIRLSQNNVSVTKPIVIH